MLKVLNNINTSERTYAFDITIPVNTDSDNPFSDEVATVCQWLTFGFLCQAVVLFGMGSNITNIICFAKQGFKDPVNVSFFGLAVADIGCLITLIWSNICFNPEFIAADLPFEPTEFQYLTSEMPHTTFTRISSWITALITLERCLCITVPMKVKTIVTSNRVSIIIVCVYIILLTTTAPFYFVYKLGVQYYPSRNKTLIGIVSMENKEHVEKIFYVINSVCVPFGAFTIIIICTILLVIKLHNKTQWRKSSTISSQADTVSTRNQKVAKMVVMISILFIACFSPLCICFIAMTIEPEISLVGKYKNAISIFGGFGSLLESINSSGNIFIYYHMSSKYKLALRAVFCLDSKTNLK